LILNLYLASVLSKQQQQHIILYTACNFLTIGDFTGCYSTI
jgi:hypothetical protein